MADELPDFLDGRPELAEAMREVQSSEEEAAKFAADPKGYLQNKGISTESLNFPEGGELTDDDLERVAGGWASCGGFGAGTVCGSLGIDLPE